MEDSSKQEIEKSIDVLSAHIPFEGFKIPFHNAGDDPFKAKLYPLISEITITLNALNAYIIPEQKLARLTYKNFIFSINVYPQNYNHQTKQYFENKSVKEKGEYFFGSPTYDSELIDICLLKEDGKNPEE